MALYWWVILAAMILVSSLLSFLISLWSSSAIVGIFPSSLSSLIVPMTMIFTLPLVSFSTNPDDVAMCALALALPGSGVAVQGWDAACSLSAPPVVCTGPLTTTWAGVTCDTDSKVIIMSLLQSDLHGSMSTEIGLMSSLKYLFLISNSTLIIIIISQHSNYNCRHT
jgi:hypothetical protein